MLSDPRAIAIYMTNLRGKRWCHVWEQEGYSHWVQVVLHSGGSYIACCAYFHVVAAKVCRWKRCWQLMWSLVGKKVQRSVSPTDLVFISSMKKISVFTRDGNDLIATQEISLAEAARGRYIVEHWCYISTTMLFFLITSSSYQ